MAKKPYQRSNGIWDFIVEILAAITTNKIYKSKRK
jgi:hypothetical protein